MQTESVEEIYRRISQYLQKSQQNAEQTQQSIERCEKQIREYSLAKLSHGDPLRPFS